MTVLQSNKVQDVKDLLSVRREKTNKMQQSDVYLSASVSTCFGHVYRSRHGTSPVQ